MSLACTAASSEPLPCSGFVVQVMPVIPRWSVAADAGIAVRTAQVEMQPTSLRPDAIGPTLHNRNCQRL
jgi:hypothetical protein